MSKPELKSYSGKTNESTVVGLMKSWLDRYGKDAGITRVTSKGDFFLIRLGWKAKKPAYQHTINVRNYGSVSEAYAAAQTIRNKALHELLENGTIMLNTGPRLKAIKTRHNLSGIAGMTLGKTQSKSGAGTSYHWKVNWTEGGVVKGRSFAWSRFSHRRSNGSCASFYKAAVCRMEAELRVYGSSTIDPGEEQIHAAYLVAMRNYDLLTAIEKPHEAIYNQHK